MIINVIKLWLSELRHRRSFLVTFRVIPGRPSRLCTCRSVDRSTAAAHDRPTTLITEVAPPAADPVALHSAVGFCVHGGEHAGQAAKELGRSGRGMGAVASYLVACGRS
ncbi:PE family protein [Mycobacterium nebraskense]|nr:PE family protein [Mycobacterium nebraskense]MCV7120157.1 PE family protein [Mycobacterium nebraskense]